MNDIRPYSLTETLDRRRRMNSAKEVQQMECKTNDGVCSTYGYCIGLHRCAAQSHYEAAGTVDMRGGVKEAEQVIAETDKRRGITTDSAERKAAPIATGVLDYFPDALADVARLSKVGNDQHNPGEPLHWSRGKSDDHADCIMRHMIDRGTMDDDGVLHDTKVAWRALAQLQLALERRREH